MRKWLPPDYSGAIAFAFAHRRDSAGETVGRCAPRSRLPAAGFTVGNATGSRPFAIVRPRAPALPPAPGGSDTKRVCHRSTVVARSIPRKFGILLNLNS